MSLDLITPRKRMTVHNCQLPILLTSSSPVHQPVIYEEWFSAIGPLCIKWHVYKQLFPPFQQVTAMTCIIRILAERMAALFHLYHGLAQRQFCHILTQERALALLSAFSLVCM